MSNLDKLNSALDMNNLDASQINKILVENQKAFMLILFVATLLAAGLIFNGHRVKEQGLRARLSQEQSKLGIIKAREASLESLDNFKSSLPRETNQFELITQISDYAKLYHVTIISLKPPESREMGIYGLLNIGFTVVSDNFKDMMLFLRNVEKSQPPLRVDTWVGSELEDGKITSDIQISAVYIHP